MGRHDQDWVVFWCSLLSPLRMGEVLPSQQETFFRELSQQERLLPNGQRRRLSVRTLRRQWKRLQDQGVQGLYRRRRSDRGKPRRRLALLLERAVELKKEQPYRSAAVINHILQKEFGRPLAPSTLYRHLRREGATRLKLGLSRQKVRCRWTRDHSNALWVGDFEHGPPVMHQGQAVQTHLSAWIDCHSRFVVEARYYRRENLDILVDSLLRAWGRHGASRELYVDNAKIYHAKALQMACTQLNIHKLHRPPRDPAPGGLIERFFQTLQMQLEAEVRASQVLSLDELNFLLSAWLEHHYHQRVHSETQQTPHQRYHQQTRFRRQVHLTSVLTFFHKRESRKVDPVHADVRIGSLYFAVDDKLRRDKVIVQYDPFSPMEEVQLYAPEGRYLGIGRRYERERGTHPFLSDPSENSSASDKPMTPHYLNVLREQQTEAHRRQRENGLDYHSAQQRSVWSLTSFTRCLARLLGRSGGASSFDPREIEALAAFHARHQGLHQGLTETLLKQAFEQADSPSIPHVLWRLQNLLDRN